MKIAYLSSSPIDKMPANAVHVMNMCDSLSQLGHTVNLHAKVDKVGHSEEYLKKYGCSNTFSFSLVSSRRFGRLAPIIYAIRQVSSLKGGKESILCYARCPFSAYFALIQGYKVIYEAHEVPHSRVLSILYKKIFRHRNLRRVVVISEALKNDLIDFGFIAKKEVGVLVAHDGASLSKNSNFLNPDSFFNSGNSRTVVGYAGGLRSGNGIEIILRLATEFPFIDFKIMGGTPEDIIAWKHISDPDNVYWLGAGPHSEVSDFLLRCDVLLAPYQNGPKTGSGRDTSRWMSPLKVFEYMAAGRAMVVSDYPVLREVLDDKNAILIAPDDFQGWVDAIKKLSTDDVLRRELGFMALKKLKADYTWVKRAEKVITGVKL